MAKKKEVEQPVEQLSTNPLPEGLLEATKKSIIDGNGQVQFLEVAIANAKTQKDKDALTKVLERTTKAMNELKESDLKIIKQTDNRFVVDAGKYGYRKVTL